MMLLYEIMQMIVHIYVNINFSLSDIQNILISNKIYKTIGPPHGFAFFFFFFL
jgi:hypothetical protein